MRKFHFHGHLARRFPEPVEMEVDTVLEGIRGIGMQVPDFLDELVEGDYYVIRGDLDNGLDLDLEGIAGFRLGDADVHIVPIVAGSGASMLQGNTGSWVKIVAGAVLVGAAIFFSGGVLSAAVPGTVGMLSWGNVAFIGVALALMGAYQLLANADDKKKKDKESYSINGPSNTYIQGGPVPLIYGEVMTGSVTVSAAVEFGDATVPEPDYVTITYNWTSTDGTDLDTTTNITAPFTTNTVGWGPSQSIITYNGQSIGGWWSGDNTTERGPENVTIDLNKVRQLAPSAATITITMYANWFAIRQSGYTVVTYATYGGGTLGPTFQPTAEGTQLSTQAFVKNVTSNVSSSTPGTFLGTATVYIDTGVVTFAVAT